MDSGQQHEEFTRVLNELRSTVRLVEYRIEQLETGQNADQQQFKQTAEALQELNKKYEEALMYLGTLSNVIKWSIRIGGGVAAAFIWIKKKAWILKTFFE